MNSARAHDDFSAPHTATFAQSRPAERRRHQRVPVNLLGRYMLSDRQEYPCQTIDMSPGGVSLIAPVSGGADERVVCYLDHIGRIEGTISRVFDTGFALRMNVPLTKREKLAEQLTWLTNRHVLGMPEDRRHERIAPRVTGTTVRLLDQPAYPARLIDVSLSGAALMCDLKPVLGAPVVVGGTPGRVVRVSSGTIAVEFARQFPAELFDENIVL